MNFILRPLLQIYRCKALLPIALGFGAFLLIAGPFVLFPSNQQWLFGGGDATQHYLGWIFFRNGPWSIPLGLNPSYGFDINNSIVYTDSIPLLAIPFKALSFLLPEPFQYFGLWVLLCFVLQALIAWKLLSLFSNDRILKILATGLFVFSVPMVSLLPENPALASQFLILGAIYLNLRNTKSFPLWTWVTLLVLSVLIHFYLFVLIASLWTSDFLDRLLIKKIISVKLAIFSVLISCISVLFFAWLAGYFAIRSVGAFGYGMFKINLLGLLNPAGWSIFVKEIYTKPHWWAEEPIYLGLGGILALLFALRYFSSGLKILKGQIWSNLFFIVILCCLGIFSISNNIGIGSFELTLPLSDNLAAIASIVRNSGRMFIPIYYLILLFICYQIIHFYPKKFSIPILSFCFLIQIIDLSPGWLDVRQRMTSNGPFPLSILPLQNSFWSSIRGHYKNLLIVPNRFNGDSDSMGRFLSSDWRIFGRFASENNMNTNAIFLARYDKKTLDSSNQKLIRTIISGDFREDSIYIIKDEEINPVLCSLLENKKILFAKIDGINVVAPNFMEKVGHLQLNNIDILSFNTSTPLIGEGISFSKSGALDNKFKLCGGWNNPENWGVWSQGGSAKIYLPLPANAPKTLELNVNAFVYANYPSQNLTLDLDNQFYSEIQLSKSQNNLIQIKIPSDALKKRYLILGFKLLNPTSPKKLGIGPDDREISIGLVSAKFR